MEAKQRRQNKGVKPQGICVKAQILEESHSDEVSPGVKRTLSPTITVKSSEAATAQIEESKASPQQSKSNTTPTTDKEPPHDSLKICSGSKSQD